MINRDTAFSNEEKEDSVVYEKLAKLELALTDRQPYKPTARLFQLILHPAE